MRGNSIAFNYRSMKAAHDTDYGIQITTEYKGMFWSVMYSQARETLDIKCNPCALRQREVCT